MSMARQKVKVVIPALALLLDGIPSERRETAFNAPDLFFGEPTGSSARRGAGAQPGTRSLN